MDITLLNSRLNLAFDWYKRKTEDILMELPSPEILGIKAPVQNAGSVENKGWEITVGWRDVIGKDFHYFINANLSDVKNKIVDLRGYKSPSSDLQAQVRPVPRIDENLQPQLGHRRYYHCRPAQGR